MVQVLVTIHSSYGSYGPWPWFTCISRQQLWFSIAIWQKILEINERYVCVYWWHKTNTGSTHSHLIYYHSWHHHQLPTPFTSELWKTGGVSWCNASSSPRWDTKIVSKNMVWGYPKFRKPSYQTCIWDMNGTCQILSIELRYTTYVYRRYICIEYRII